MKHLLTKQMTNACVCVNNPFEDEFYHRISVVYKILFTFQIKKTKETKEGEKVIE